MDERPTNQNDRSQPTVMLDYAPPDPLVRRVSRYRLLGIGWLELLAILAILLVLAAILLPALSTREPGTLGIRCMSNMQQIGMGLTQYAASNGGVYPKQLADLCSLGLPPAELVCPASKTQTPAFPGTTPQQTVNNVLAGTNHVTYIYLVGGMQASSLKPGAVAAYEPLGDHSSNVRGVENVLFVDGHVASVPAPQFKQMIKELTAGQNPAPALKGY